MRIIIVIAVVISMAVPAQAGIGSQAAEELAEFVMKKFGKEAVKQGAGKLAGRIIQAAGRHGDDVVTAIRRVGPRAISLADDAGSEAPRVLRLLNRYGDDAARVLSQPKGLALISRYGDDAAKALIKHNGVAGELVENVGAPAVKAFNAIGPRAGRRLAMMAGDDLTAIGRTPELLEVVARYGDTAMDFIWKHRVLLASSATLAAFLGDPEPFLKGTADLTKVVTQEVVKPAAAAVTENVIKPAATAVNENVIKPAATAVTENVIKPAATAVSENMVKPAAKAATDAVMRVGTAIQPTVSAATGAALDFAVWIAGGLLAALIAFALIARMIAKSGILAKKLLRTWLRLAGGRIFSAVRQK